MSELKIDKGVQIPPRRADGMAAALRKMKRGDSVLLPTDMSSARASAHRELGKGCYASRSEGEGTRIWRIK